MLSPITRYLMTQAMQSHPLTEAPPCRLPQKQSLLVQIERLICLRNLAERESSRIRGFLVSIPIKRVGPGRRPTVGLDFAPVSATSERWRDCQSNAGRFEIEGEESSLAEFSTRRIRELEQSITNVAPAELRTGKLSGHEREPWTRMMRRHLIKAADQVRC